MAIELIDKIKPKNSGGFPLVDACDVQMPDGTRLNKAIDTIPVYLTQEEYDALSEAEQASGTYVIVDYVNQTDTTLTKAGQAADAMAVGDRLAQLENALGTGLAELDTLIGGDG